MNSFTALGPEGGVIVQAAYHPQNSSIAYVAAPSGFYRSDDSAQSWELVTDILGGPSAFAIHPSSAERVFLTYQSNGLFSMTESDGVLQISTFPLPQSISGPIAAAPDGTIYVATASHVFWSSNLGASWSQSSAVPPTDTAIRVLKVDPVDSATIYAVSQGKNIFQSVNRGATWTVLTPPDTASLVTYVDDLAITNSVPKRILLATNFGLWSRLENEATWSNSAPVSAPYRSIETDPNGPFVYATSAYDGLYRSADDGLTWVNIQSGALTGIVSAVAISPSDPDQLMMGGYEGLVASSDGGASWESRNAGIIGPRAETVVAAASSDRIYVQTQYNGVFAVDGETRSVAPVNNAQMRAFANNPLIFNTRGLTVESGANDVLMTTVSRGIARSLDGGATWQLHTSLALQGVHAVATAYAQGDAVLLGAGNGVLYRSVDDGVSWPVVSGLNSYISLSLITTAPSNPSRVYMAAAAAPTTQSVLRSDDAGATWQATSTLPSGYLLTVAVDPSNDDVVYAAVAPAGLFRSDDGGASWEELDWLPTPDTPWAVAVDPQNSNILYASSAGAIRRSVDAGATWESLPTPALPSYWDVRSLAVDPNRPHHLYAGAQDDGLRMISIQPDLKVEGTAFPTQVAHGAVTRFSYTAKNQGSFAATNVTATIALTGDVSQVVGSMAGGSCTSTANALTCTRAALRADESSIIHVNVVYAKAGDATVTASVSGDQPDPVATDNSIQTAVKVGELLSDLSIEWAGPATLVVGNPASYTLTVRNSGPHSASDVSVAVSLASTLSAVSAVPSTGSCSLSAAGSVACTIPSLSAQQSVTIAIATSPTAAGTHNNTATVSANGVDSIGNNNEATFTTNVTTIPALPPSGGGQNSGGGGGGGSGSWLLLGALASLRFGEWRKLRLRNSDAPALRR